MSGVLSRIKPTRAQAEPPKLIADLDQLMPRPMSFKLGGKVYTIEVGTVRKLAQMSDRLEAIFGLVQRKALGEKVSDEDLYTAYHQYLSVLCPKLTLDVILTMTLPQLRKLLTEIIRYATGQQTGVDSPADAEKKKTIA